MEIAVLRAGQASSIQDLGRVGRRDAGVPSSGAMDSMALRVANLLVGNSERAAGIEFAFTGPELEFGADTLVALGGCRCDGVPSWQPITVRAGQRIRFGACVEGVYGCIAVAGGIDVPEVLGSRSTYLRGGFGGHDGRLLRDGDRLRARDLSDSFVAPVGVAHWRVDPRILPAYSRAPQVRVTPGAQASEFPRGFFETDYIVSPQSDRMGLRLSGEKMIRQSGGDLLSMAVAPGTIQIPPDGEPLLLMADAQTIGGYPQIAHVIAVDLPLVAQARPGDAVRFVESSLEEAHRLWHAREHALALLRQGLALKFQ
jgi:antagonist of KipI